MAECNNCVALLPLGRMDNIQWKCSTHICWFKLECEAESGTSKTYYIWIGLWFICLLWSALMSKHQLISYWNGHQSAKKLPIRLVSGVLAGDSSRTRPRSGERGWISDRRSIGEHETIKWIRSPAGIAIVHAASNLQVRANEGKCNVWRSHI